MIYNTVFYLIIFFILFDFILDRYLDYLNSRTRKAVLPDELKGIYDEEKYIKSIEYEQENARFELITSSFDLVLVLTMLFFGGFAWIDTIAGNYTENPIYRGLLFFLILGLASDLIHTPFSIYDIFVIEQKYGFNKTTPRLFLFDKLKGWILSLVIGGGLGFLILWFYYKTTTMFWIYAWALTSVFTLFFTMFYSNIIVPLFNKQETLADGELKESINNFATKVGFKLKNIYTMDGSKRSTKANAYFTGLGAKKRIVLFDTLMKELSTSEIVAVLAHEIGHYKHKHTSQGIIISLIQMGVTFFLLSIFLKEPSLSQALGVNTPSFHIAIITFGILYSPFSLVIGLFMNVLSRKNEYQADRYAKTNFESEALISALKKLSVNNLSNLTPHPTYVYFHYSHPTLLQRIKALKNLK
jgi:STE24 endopeptidase